MLSHRLRLRRTKVKEMEARPFRILVMHKRYKEVANYFSCFLRIKSSLVGRIDRGGFSDIVAWEKLKIQSGGNEINLTSDRSAHHHDSNGVK